MPSSKERLFELDLVRLAATLAVVMIHVSSTYLPGDSGGYFLNQLARFAVPLFFAVSGASLLAAYGQHLQIPAFYRGRLRKVFIPFVIWTGFYLLASYHFKLPALTDPAFWFDYLKYLGLGIDHLYFIVIILQLYILYPLLLKIYRSAGPKWLLAGSLALSLATQTIVYLMRWNILVFPTGLSVYLYLLFPAWVFFMALGMYYVELQKDRRSRSGQVLNPGFPTIPCLWTGLAFLTVLTDSLLTNTYGSSIKPSTMLYASLSLPCLWQLGAWIKNSAPARALECLSFFSRQSFFLFFAHVEVMRILRKMGEQFIMPGIWEHVYGLLALYILTVGVTAALSLLLPRWRYAWLVGGAK